MAEAMREDTIETEQLMHASAVEIAGRALVIAGASGSGKSSLCLSLMALGGRLIGDDRIHLIRSNTQIFARAPTPLAGLIEAWGIGVLIAEQSEGAAEGVPVAALVDLDQIETTRLPLDRKAELLGLHIPLILGQRSPHFAAALRQYLVGSRHA